MRVRFGVELPHRPELLGPAATRAEALGFDSVWIGDHVAFHYFTVPAERVLEQLERFGAEVLARVPDWIGASAAPPVAWRT